jgi:hypothetical protein
MGGYWKSGLVVRPEGVLDLDTAREWLVRLTELPELPPVVLDLRGPWTAHDAALGLLVTGLQRAGAEATFQGLCLHQTRLLRYLGVRSAESAAENASLYPNVALDPPVTRRARYEPGRANASTWPSRPKL